MAETYRISFSKEKQGLALLFFSACFAFGAHLLFNKPPGPVPVKWSFIFKNSHQAAIFCMVATAPLIIMSLKSFFSSKPTIIVDSRGVYDSRHVKALIPWSDIANSGAYSTNFLGQELEVLALELTEAGHRNARFKFFYYLNSWLYNKGGPNIACFHLNGLDYDQSELNNALMAGRRVRPQQPIGRQGVPRTAQRLFN